MKKITLYFLAVFLLGFSYTGIAQTLNQNAGWPNANWTVTGTFNSDPAAFEADPTTTSNFAFDDDDAGPGNADDIAAESPAIDLTAAFNAGETWLTISVDYYYNKLNPAESLTLEYWDADAGAWVIWDSLDGTDAIVQDDFCTGTRVSFTSSILNIVNFSGSQQSGFKYRLYFNDAGGWVWGFCFDAPTIVSETPPACPAPINLSADNFMPGTAVLSWTEIGSAASWDVEFLNVTTGETVTGVPNNSGITNPLTKTGLVDGNEYAFYVRSNCLADGFSEWSGPYNFTFLVPPPNDTMAGAIPIEPAPEGTGCASAGFTLTFATDNTTDSGMDGSCNGPDTGLDQFFTWTATTDALIFNSLAPGNPGIVIRDDMGVEITCTTTFADVDSVLSGWTIGQDLIIQIFDFAGSLSDVAFCLEEFTLPDAPDCATEPITPTNGETDVSAFGTITVSWTAPTSGPTPTSYDLYLGTQSDGSDLALAASTVDTSIDGTIGVYDLTVYWTVVPLNGPTPATGCPLWSFTTESAPPPPANDDCSGATEITPGADYNENPLDGTVEGATADAEAASCGLTGPGVWYSVVVPADGNITFETGPDIATGTTSFDSVIEAFSGSCGALTSLGCDDDGADTGLFSLLELTGLTPGSTIYLRIWAYNGGSFAPFSVSAYNATLSVDDFETQSLFSYYPNPVTNNLTLNAQKDIQNVVVYNMLGQQVMRTAPNTVNSEVDMSTLNTGSYFVQVTIDNATETIRIIKN